VSVVQLTVRKQTMNDANNLRYSPRGEERLLPRPSVVFWFKVYATALCLLLIPAGILSWMLASSNGGFGDPIGKWSLASIGAYVFSLCAWGMVLSAIILLFKAPQPHHWTLGLVLICIGLLTPILLPASTPLIIFWLRPATKSYYGRQ
jgi:hypothetical protein